MQVKINSTYRASCLFIFQHTLRPVAKRKNTYSGTADRSLCRQPVHITVRNTFGSHITFHPRIQYTGTIDTQQHSQTGLLGSMIYMGKSIHPGFRIIIHLTVHAIYHSRCSCRRSNLSRIEHIERQSIIRLVSGAIGYRNSLFQAQFFGSPCIYTPLLAKSRFDISYQRTVESIIIHQEARDIICLKIPEHPFGQTGHRGTNIPRQFHSDIIAGQHYFINTFVYSRLILFNPCQFGSGKIPRRVQQMRKTLRFPQCLKRFLPVWNRP